jgi:hypothetical protein
VQTKQRAGQDRHKVPLGNMPEGQALTQVPLKFSSGVVHEVQLEGSEAQVVQLEAQESQLREIRLA